MGTIGKKSKAFTLRGKGRLGVLVTPCGVGVAFVPSSGGKPSAVRQYNAIWDTGATDILVGMSIIRCGDFAITHPGGDTTFSFQMPSTHNIDFVEEGKEDVK